MRDDAVRLELTHMVAMLTETQRERLREIHSHAPWKSLADVPDSKLNETYELVRRTLEKAR